MGRSERLRLSDVRAAFRLVGEVRELGADPTAWSTHLLTGLSRIVGAKVGLTSEARGWRAGALRTLPVAGTDVGWADAGERARFLEWMGRPEADGPDFAPYCERLDAEGGCFSCTRCELVTDADWYSSAHLNEFRRLASLDDFVYATCVLPHLGGLHILALHRTRGDRPFSRRDRRLVQLVNEELGLMWAAEAMPEVGLPPRMRQVLERLLRGDSEKEVARDLGLSPHTIHRHVGLLYRRLGVSSRGELLAKCLGGRAAHRPRLALEPGSIFDTIHTNSHSQKVSGDLT